MTHSDEDMGWLIDRLRIRDCLTRYARGLDRHDAALIASAFWPDARIRYGTLFDGALDPFVAWSNASHAARWTGHSHNITNQNVTFDADRAAADVETYVQFFHRGPTEQIDIGIGRYLDRFARRDGEWRIAARSLVVDMMMKTEGVPIDAIRFPVGGWEDDASYARPFANAGGSA